MSRHTAEPVHDRVLASVRHTKSSTRIAVEISIEEGL